MSAIGNIINLRQRQRRCQFCKLTSLHQNHHLLKAKIKLDRHVATKIPPVTYSTGMRNSKHNPPSRRTDRNRRRDRWYHWVGYSGLFSILHAFGVSFRVKRDHLFVCPGVSEQFGLSKTTQRNELLIQGGASLRPTEQVPG